MEGFGRADDAWAMDDEELPLSVATTSIFSAHLRKLRLSLRDLSSEEQRPGAVGEFLSRARGLKSLFLTCGISGSCEDRVDSLLSQCHFPELRTLIVEGGTMQNMDVPSIFCGVRNLQHLALEDLRIDRPYWKAVIDGIKSSLDLESLHMNLLKSGVDWNKGLEVYVDGGNEVDNFFHSKGSHPFPDNAEYCKIDSDSNKYFGLLWDGSLAGNFRPRVAQQYYERYF